MKKKIMVLGIDGMDPRFTKYLMDKGELPAIAEYVKRGACREDLVMLGAQPTITPPMWTTLATGAYPSTHGITCFWNSDPEDRSRLVYSLDSTKCKAEPIWNVAVENGYRTLVWHWPGSSWPPTSDNPKLHVVDGVQPGFIGFGTALKEDEVIINISPKAESLQFIAGGAHANTGAGCLLSDVDIKPESSGSEIAKQSCENAEMAVENIMLTLEDGEFSLENMPYDVVNAPIGKPEGWAVDVPADAQEFSILLSKGYLRRPCLLLKDETGEYNTVQIFKSKKDTEPMLVLKFDELSPAIVDDVVEEDGTRTPCFRAYKFFRKETDKNEYSIWVGRALERDNDEVWHPKSLYKEIIDNVGYYTTASPRSARIPYYTKRLMLPTWEAYNEWQADCLEYFVKNDKYDFILSHLHNVDGIGHSIWAHAYPNGHTNPDHVAVNREFMAETYRQTDRYLGRFLKYIDEGWTILIVSDHGLLVDREKEPALLGDPYGVNAKLFDEMGLTVLKRDENGNPLKEIDWEKTVCYAPRTCHIYLNLKGRDPHGIVDPEDQYQVEQDIIDKLYALRDKTTGRRLIALALRNKDALLLGCSGPEFGDIVYWSEEGFHRVHGESLSTMNGEYHTSVSPIFIAAGPGIKPGYTERVIREVDVTPTLAELLDVRMPEQCEGAPVYQILDSRN